jgi:hypothetical protein
MKRNIITRSISIKMEYPETCKLSKEERDEMLLFIQRIIRSYVCADHEVEISIADEYGKETEKL